jgi:hypothetical protein
MDPLIYVFLGIVFATQLLFVAWMLFDSSFASVVHFALVLLRVRSESDVPFILPRAWRELGARAILFCAMVTFFIACSIAHLFWLWTVPDKVLPIVALVSDLTVFALLFFTSAICQTGRRLRLFVMRRQIVAFCRTLLDNWPSEAGQIRLARREYYFRVDETLSNVLLVSQKHSIVFPFQERIGQNIRRLDGTMERICVDIDGSLTDRIEYCVGAARPASFEECCNGLRIRHQLQESKGLGQSLYLSRYQVVPDLIYQEHS